MKIYQRDWFWFLVILALIALNQTIFHFLFKISYFEWYLKNGSVIGAIATVIAFALDVNGITDLISANPRCYVLSYFALAGIQIRAFGFAGGSGKQKSEEGLGKLVMHTLDGIFSLILLFLMMVVFILWIIVITPVQYFLILLLGGSGRRFLASSLRSVAKVNRGKMEIKEIPRDEKTPDGWMDTSLARKSVTFTYALIALALAVVKLFM
jgi:hypothetical protein